MGFGERLARAAEAVVRELTAAAAAGGPAGRRAVVDRPFEPLEGRYLLSAALDLIGVTALRADPEYAGIDGSGCSVAVIDTGVDFTHPLLSGGKVDQYDFNKNSATVTVTDEHGTHVAGIVGARDANIGVAPATGLIGLQVFTKTSSGSVLAYDSNTESALKWVLDHRAQYNIVAVNMSLGSGNLTADSQGVTSVLYDDVKLLEKAGVTVVSAAGNDYANLQKPGSASPGVFSALDVGAVYETNEGQVTGSGGEDFSSAADRLAFFSQRPNTSNELFAPGAFITSTVPGGKLKDLAGTSMAAPMVAGVVALMQDAAQTYAGRLLSPAEVKTIVQQTADVVVDGDDEDTSVKTTGQSYLRVNAYRAVKYIRTSLGGSTAGTASTDPNGTVSTAVTGPTLSGTASTGSGNIGADGQTAVGASDVDMIRFTMAGPGQVNVSATGAGFGPSMRIFNSAGTQVVATTAGSGSSTAALSVTLGAGDYFLGVSGAGNTAYSATVAGSGKAATGSGAYTLSASLAGNTDVDGVLTAANAVNLIGGRTPQGFGGNVGLDGASTVGAKDVDFYRLIVSDTGQLLVDLDTLAATFPNTYVRVFDATGTEIGQNDNSLATDLFGNQAEFDPFPAAGHLGDAVTDAAGAAAGHDTDSFVSVPVTAGKVYYVAVSTYENRAYSTSSTADRVAAGGTGAYTLFITLRNRDQNGAIGQAIDVASLPVSRGTFTIGVDRVSGNTFTAVGSRDVDMFHFRPAAAGILEFDVDSLVNGPSLSDFDPGTLIDGADSRGPIDTVLRVFAADGTLLATEGAAPDGIDPVVRLPVSAGADYYVAVAGVGNDGFNPFLLGSGSPGATGRFAYSARLLPPTDAVALSDDTVSGGTVKALTVGTTVRSTLGEDDAFVRGHADVDVWTFAAKSTGSYTFNAGPSDEFGADTVLRLFAADGTPISWNQDGGGRTGNSLITATLARGRTYLVCVSGAGTNATGYDPVTGANSLGGDNSTGGYFLTASAAAAPAAVRTMVFDAFGRATYADADGSLVTVSLKGPGTGTLSFAADDDADASFVSLTGTTEQTTLTVVGNTAAGGLRADGPLKAVVAKGLDLTGTVSFAGGIAKSAWVGRLTDADVTVGEQYPLSLTAGDVLDADLTAPGGIRSLKVSNWTDSAATSADVVSAPQVLSLTAAGTFGADVSADDVGKVKVGGALTGDVRSGGSITSVTAGSLAGAAVFAGVDPAFTGRLPTAFVDPSATIGSFVVRGTFAGAFADARIAAPIIRKLAVGDVTTANTGVPLGVVADGIGSLTGSFDGGAERVRSKNLGDPAQSLVHGDAVVTLL